MKNLNISFLLVLLLMQFAFVLQAQDARFSKVFYNPEKGMHVLASAEAGQDSLMMISAQKIGYIIELGAVHLMDATGTIHWSKRLVTGTSWIRPFDIVRTADQNFLICATESRYNPEEHSVLLIKLNVAGDLLWVKKFEFAKNTFAKGIALSASGDILVTGRAQVYPIGNSHLLLMRFTGDGALLWAKTYDGCPYGFPMDQGVAVAELADGQLMVGGITRGFEPYSEELALTKTDAAGNVLWAKRKVTPGGYQYNSTINDLIAGPSGFYLCGTAIDSKEMVMAFDSDGEIIWSKSFVGSSFKWPNLAFRGRINTTASGNLLMSHRNNMGSRSQICQIAADGSAVWSQNVDMQAIEARPLADGGCLFLGINPLTDMKGVTYSSTGVIRTDALGEGVDCTSEGDINLENYAPAFENFSYEAITDVGSVVDYSLQWEEFPLDSFDGCANSPVAVGENPDVVNALKVFPNPGNGPFRLLHEDLQPESLVQLTVYNGNGQRIFSREGIWSQLQMIDRKLPAGIYLINLKTENSVFTTRLIVN